MPAERPEEAPPREVAAKADESQKPKAKPEAAESASEEDEAGDKPAPIKPKPAKKRR
jgi:hypothetical protein